MATGTNTAICSELTCKVDCEQHQQHAYIDHLLSGLMSTTPVSMQLTVADTRQDETSNQNGLLDVVMLSSPMVDSQLSADLPSDSVSFSGTSSNT